MPSFNPFVPTFEDEELVRVPSGASIVEPESVLGESGRSYHGYKEGKYLLPNDAVRISQADPNAATDLLRLTRPLAIG